MQESLHRNLQHHQYTEDLVSDALLILLDLLGKHVAQAPDSFRKMVIRPGEVERRNAERIDRRDGRNGVEVFEDILLNTEFCEERLLLLIRRTGKRFIEIEQASLLCGLELLLGDAALELVAHALPQHG